MAGPPSNRLVVQQLDGPLSHCRRGILDETVSPATIIKLTKVQQQKGPKFFRLYNRLTFWIKFSCSNIWYRYRVMKFSTIGPVEIPVPKIQPRFRIRIWIHRNQHFGSGSVLRKSSWIRIYMKDEVSDPGGEN